jgi:hypothetical protein
VTEAQWLAPDAIVTSLAYFLGNHIYPSGSYENGPLGRKLRLHSCACCYCFIDILTDERSRRALEVSERFADGLATKKELANAKRHATRARVAVGGGWSSEAWAACHIVEEVASAQMSRVIDAVGPAERVGRWTRHTRMVLFRDIFGNPFRPVPFALSWRTDTALTLARTMYESRDFSAMPILGDALQDAGCDSDDILNHCRGPGPHVRGCWVVDLVLGKE